MNRSSVTGHDRSTRATARRREDIAPITYQRAPLVDADTKLLAMGSCFAVEIRRALRECLRMIQRYPYVYRRFQYTQA